MIRRLFSSTPQPNKRFCAPWLIFNLFLAGTKISHKKGGATVTTNINTYPDMQLVILEVCLETNDVQAGRRWLERKAKQLVQGGERL